MNSQEKKWSVSEVIEHLSSTEEAIKFLHENGIVKVADFESIEHYETGDGREGLIIQLQVEGNGTLSSVIIDIRKRQPSTDQVYDLVYGVGKDCLRRVIVFTDEDACHDDWNPTVDELAVRSLIEAMNAYPLKLHLVKFNNDRFNPELNERDVSEEEGTDFSTTDLPSPDRFRAEEFWAVYFDWHNDHWYECWNAFKGGIREASDWGHMLYTEPEVAEIPVYWTESGIKYVVKQTDEDGDYLKKIWTLKQDELKRMYHGRCEFEYLPGKLPKIIIQFSDRPVSWLMTATATERFEFAKQLHTDFYGLRIYLNEVMEEAEDVRAA